MLAHWLLQKHFWLQFNIFSVHHWR